MGPSKLFRDLSGCPFEQLKARRACEEHTDSTLLVILGDDIHCLVFLHTNLLGVDCHTSNAVLVHAKGRMEVCLFLQDPLSILKSASLAIV